LYITYEIWNQTAIRRSPSRVLKEGFPIGPNICLVIIAGVDIVIVSGIKKRIPENEQGNMILRQAGVSKALGWENKARTQNQETEMEP
jgi:hypothetical protein